MRFQLKSSGYKYLCTPSIIQTQVLPSNYPKDIFQLASEFRNLTFFKY